VYLAHVAVVNPPRLGLALTDDRLAVAQEALYLGVGGLVLLADPQVLGLLLGNDRGGADTQGEVGQHLAAPAVPAVAGSAVARPLGLLRPAPEVDVLRAADVGVAGHHRVGDAFLLGLQRD
jgi:hypothetical protein